MSAKFVNGEEYGCIAHENRIQNLEESLTELKVSHAEVVVGLSNLSQRVAENTENILSKIDSIAKPFAETVAKVNVLEASQAVKESRKKALRAFVVAVITSALAISLKELAVLFFKH